MTSVGEAEEEEVGAAVEAGLSAVPSTVQTASQCHVRSTEI